MLFKPTSIVTRIGWRRFGRFISVLLISCGLSWAGMSIAQAQSAVPVWDEADSAGNVQVHLYFFWSETCPHCQAAYPFVTALPNRYPWLKLHALEVSRSDENAQRYVNMAAAVGEEARYVPAFFFGGKMMTGYDGADTTGRQLVTALDTYRAAAQARYGAAHPAAPPLSEPATAVAPAASIETITLPGLGAVNLTTLSRPVFTVTIALLDAFNPCAFFVLMFLLSLMVHARSRARMLLIGGVFVLFSGLIYFIFMAAWLNVFLWVGELRLITLAAGLLAVGMALINIKDFFWFKRGVSLTLSEPAQSSLHQRMRTLVNAGSLPAMLASTVLLAVAANSYELLCTSGFPLIYTRTLTLSHLPQATYYGYLALYNGIYILPLLVIVTLFMIKFGARKLSEIEGRRLKLLSGTMMLLLGGLLLVAPAQLNNPLTALLLLVAALLITWVIVQITERRTQKATPHPKHKRHAHHVARHS